MGKDNPKLRKNGGEGTKVGNFLREIGRSDILEKAVNVVGNVATGNYLGAVKAIVSSDKELTPENKELALKEIEKDIAIEQEISKRWQADVHSDSWLSKNIRPMVLLYLVLCTTVCMVLDSADVLEVKEHWVSLMTSLLLTTIGAYFGLREAGKFISKKYK